MKSIVSHIASIRDEILDILFPSTCLGCGLRGDMLCPSCTGMLKKARFEEGNNIYAIFDYKDPLIKKAIWSLKYHNKTHVARILGKFLHEEFIEEISELKSLCLGSPMYVVPVPLSSKRKNTRGYNQAEKLAKSFCRESEKNSLELRTDLIYKTVDTLQQAKITNRNRRLKNVRGAFSIKNQEEIRGKTIIVIDDVTTTGGTFLEILRMLKKGGAKKVIAFAIAH